MRITALMTGLAAALALGSGALAQDTGATGGTDAPEAEQTAPATDDTRRPGRGEGYRDGRHGGMGGPRYRDGQGQDMHRRGMMMDDDGDGYGRMHHRRSMHGGMGRGRGPTLKIETRGRGFELEFECNAPMEQCLAAVERVYEISAENRRRGPRRDDDRTSD